jgi:hypothetical protein
MKTYKTTEANDFIPGIIDEIKLIITKLSRFTSNLSQDELDWTPSGVNNSLSWILKHITTELWACYSLLTSEEMKFDPLSAGLAFGSIKGIKFGKNKNIPHPPAHDPLSFLDDAWTKLNRVLSDSETDYDKKEVFAGRRNRSSIWFIIHCLGDFSYHTGQASYLRKLIAKNRSKKNN